MIDPNFDLMTIPLGYTRDDDGRVLSYRDESGFWFVYTYDDDGRVVTCVNSDGHWYTYAGVDDATTTANTQSHARARRRQHDRP
jgi:YD repeat-containing protein